MVIPLYNPPPNWEASCLGHILALQTMFPEYKFHFSLVNDGSHQDIFKQIRKDLERSKIAHSLYKLNHNFGKGKALRTGATQSKNRGNFFICVDWDFPFGVAVIGEIIKKMQAGFEVVTVNRGDDYLKRLPFFRSLLTRMWRMCIKRILKLQMRDTQAGLKGFSKSALPYFIDCQINSFLVDVEFILKCKENKVKLTSIEAALRGGVKLDEFSPVVYARELSMLILVMYRFYLQPKYGYLYAR